MRGRARAYGKKFVLVAIVAIFLSFLLPLHQGTGLESQTTTLSVEPTHNFGLNVGDTFSVNITVSNVTDLTAWQFRLYYKSAVLNGTSYEEGPFLKSGGANTFFYVVNFTDNYNATDGLAFFACAQLAPGEPVPGVNGTGTIATITFHVINGGGSILHLDDTILDDSADPPNHIPHTLIDGDVYVGIVDVAVTDIAVPINIAKGTMALINVTAQNKGQIAETFDVTLKDDANPIETKSVINLTAGDTMILNFTWDTNPVSIGEYNLIAIATPVPGEHDLSRQQLHPQSLRRHKRPNRNRRQTLPNGNTYRIHNRGRRSCNHSKQRSSHRNIQRNLKPRINGIRKPDNGSNKRRHGNHHLHMEYLRTKLW